MGACSPLFGTAKWKRLRLSVLRDEPLCRPCSERGLTVEAVEVDHITPREQDGSVENFYNRDGLQPICVPCHRNKTIAERRGKRYQPRIRRVNLDGSVG